MEACCEGKAEGLFKERQIHPAVLLPDARKGACIKKKRELWHFEAGLLLPLSRYYF
jgi:hypothetical protein